MNSISLHLPKSSSIVFNSLYPSSDPKLLVQDILLVKLPNDVFIDVGWYPEHDPNGRYVIHVFKGDWNNQMLATPLGEPDANQVALRVENLAARYSSQETIKNINLPSVSNTSGSSMTIFSSFPAYPNREHSNA